MLNKLFNSKTLCVLVVLLKPSICSADYHAYVGSSMRIGSAEIDADNSSEDIKVNTFGLYGRLYFQPVAFSSSTSRSSSSPAYTHFAAFLEKASSMAFLFDELKRERDIKYKFDLSGSGSAGAGLTIPQPKTVKESKLSFSALGVFSKRYVLGLETEATEYSNSSVDSVRKVTINPGYYVLENAKLTMSAGEVRRNYTPYVYSSSDAANDYFALNYFHVFKYTSARPVSIELDYSEEQNTLTSTGLTTEFTLTDQFVLGAKITTGDNKLNNSDSRGFYIRAYYYWQNNVGLHAYAGTSTTKFNNEPNSPNDADSQQAGVTIRYYF